MDLIAPEAAASRQAGRGVSATCTPASGGWRQRVGEAGELLVRGARTGLEPALAHFVRVAAAHVVLAAVLGEAGAARADQVVRAVDRHAPAVGAARREQLQQRERRAEAADRHGGQRDERERARVRPAALPSQNSGGRNDAVANASAFTLSPVRLSHGRTNLASWRLCRKWSEKV